LNDGRFGFQAIHLDVSLETDHDQVAAVRKAAERAERGSLVSLSLRIPVEVELDVREVEPETKRTPVCCAPSSAVRQASSHHVVRDLPDLVELHSLQPG
jgi:hypothetical protein